jgi:leucyl aminopeptidase
MFALCGTGSSLTWPDHCGDNRGVVAQQAADVGNAILSKDRRTPTPVSELQFSIKRSAPEKVQAGCVAVGVSELRKLSTAAESLDRASGGRIRAVLAAGDMEGKAGTTRLLYGVPGVAASRVLLVGLGKDTGPKEYRDAVRSATAALADTGTEDACFYLAEAPVRGVDASWKARHMVLAGADALYRFEDMKSKKEKRKTLVRLGLGLAAQGAQPGFERGLAEGRAIAAGIKLARDLGNLPGNVCTPDYLADTASRVGRECKLAVEVLGRKDMERLGMGALLSVAKGSRQPPRLIVLRHGARSAKKQPVVLVGKGVTFDSGGISIKPSGEMDEMKFDMCGAASVLGTLRAVAGLRLPLGVVGIVPATENMPDGAASKPGDIVTSLSGQTVEVLNTDAEGRLILCDALTYAERFKPQAVIDIATLTGACVVALGHVCSGLFANRDSLARELLAAGTDAWDRAWQLPLWDDYQEQLKSNFADFANIGGRPAGSITAACFLSRFTKQYDWAHIDIAGTAWRTGKEKGATGRPIPLLTSFLMKRADRQG